jgi:hypothetical protein
MQQWWMAGEIHLTLCVGRAAIRLRDGLSRQRDGDSNVLMAFQEVGQARAVWVHHGADHWTHARFVLSPVRG